MTIIAFATTAPELFVATIGALDVSTDIGLGAIVGSNIANIGLVLGVAALITPLSVSDTVMRRHVPFMVFAAFALVLAGLDGTIGRLEGALLLLALAGFTAYLPTQSTPIRHRWRTPPAVVAESNCEMLRSWLVGWLHSSLARAGSSPAGPTCSQHLAFRTSLSG